MPWMSFGLFWKTTFIAPIMPSLFILLRKYSIFMMLFLMMSGLFNIVESMPQWAIWLNKLNPISYFILIIRMVMLKGATLSDIAVPLGSLAVYAVVAMTLAIALYQKKTA